MADPTYLGSIQDVVGSTVSVSLADSAGSGLLFVEGSPYRVGQVGSFVRIPLGFTDLLGVVARAGAGAVPERLASQESISRRWLTVELVGSGSTYAGFERGILLLPSIGDPVHLVTEGDLPAVFGQASAADRVRIGSVAGTESIPALVDVNALVTRHVAVVGATGAGKSTTVARLVAALSEGDRYPSARILMLDIHGEYAQALAGRARIFRVGGGPDATELHVPYWALSFDELMPLSLGALPDDAAAGPVRDEIVQLKREGFERQPRDGLSEQDITVDTPVPFSIHRLWFNLHRKLNATHTAGPTSQSEATEALLLDDQGSVVEAGDAMRVVPPRYRPATQAAGADKIYLSGSTLNIRRQVDGLASRLRDPRFAFLFDPGPWAPAQDGATAMDIDQLLESWVGSPEPVTILDLSGVPSSVLTLLIGALTRVLYDALFWARHLSEGGRERPLLFVFEEAHAYLSRERRGMAAEAVQRVVKEGRKYGVGAMIVSQRPAEVDHTILSQCGTIVALRLSNPADRTQVSAAVTDSLSGVLGMLPALRTGEAIVVGEAVSLPMRALIDPPDRLPDSQDPKVVAPGQAGGWDRAREPSDYADVVARWRSANPDSSRLVK